MSMKKVSSEEAKAVLAQVGPTLRALSEENSTLKEKVAFFEKRDECEKLASVMEEKNLDPDTTHKQKVDALMARDDLAVVKEALNLSAPQIKLAELSDSPGNPSDAKSSFEMGIMELAGS